MSRAGEGQGRLAPARPKRWLRRWSLLLIALVVLLGLGLWLAPAAALQAWLSMQEHPLQLQQTSGRLLHGSADKARWQGLDLGRLDWHVVDAEPMAGRIETHFDSEGRNARLSGATWLGLDGAVQAQDIAGHLPAAWIDLSALLPLVFPVGELHLDLARLNYAPGQLPLVNGQIQWRDAGLTGLARARFGHIDMQLQSVDQGLVANISSQPADSSQAGADILVDGQLTSDGVDYRASLRLRVDPARKDLSRLLGTIARPAADGSLQLEFSGKLFPQAATANEGAP